MKYAIEKLEESLAGLRELERELLACRHAIEGATGALARIRDYAEAQVAALAEPQKAMDVGFLKSNFGNFWRGMK